MDMKDILAWKEMFFQHNFNVDRCLSNYSLKSDLKTLRTDLKDYGNELHHQMSDILKTETEAIVNLAEYLTNLNSKINDLSLPVSQLREETKTLYEIIQTAESAYLESLESLQNSNSRYHIFMLKSAITNFTLNIDRMFVAKKNLIDDPIGLQRIVNNYASECNYLGEFHRCKIKEVDYLEKKLTNLVNKMFLRAVKNRDEAVILKCLRMYDYLGKYTEAESTYQVNIVRPYLKHLFTDTNLDSCNQDVTNIYDQALQFVDYYIGMLLNILKKAPELNSFNFILNSFWVEIDIQSREGLPYITAPGNPELFQKRFNSTLDFLFKIATLYGDVKLLTKNESFQNHIKRFNLPVYFEIRFQKIAGQFETELLNQKGVSYCNENEINCKLKITLAFWMSLKSCFDNDVFIINLADQFLKLSMLLLSRYLKWFQFIILTESNMFDNSEALETFVIDSLNDLYLVSTMMSNTAENDALNVYVILPRKIKKVFFHVSESNCKSIGAVSSQLQNHLITIKCKESLVHLQNVAAIPRLYRRTNRNAPMEPSNYVIETVELILQFDNKFKTVVKNEIKHVLNIVIENITKQYSTLVEDVLRSVCRTEESLRRLKNRNAQLNEFNTEVENVAHQTDEMKIRKQIKLDVIYFIDKLGSFALAEGQESMCELRNQIC